MSRIKKRGNRTAKDLRRSSRTEKISNKCTLIITEGKNTEPNYLEALRKRLGLKATRIEVIHPDGTDPVTLTNEAIKRRDKRKRESSKSNTKVPYDEVWVAFDLEKSHDERRLNAKKAENLAGVRGIKFAKSDPSFEFWRLLHEKYTAKSLDSCKAVTNELKKVCPAYTKSEIPSTETLNKIPAAVKNSQDLRKDNQTSGRSNPATDMDLLVRSMNGAALNDLQFVLPAK
ncbi:MAG: RloB family protein [Pontiella sp.]